jgi:hypothetical protein
MDDRELGFVLLLLAGCRSDVICQESISPVFQTDDDHVHSSSLFQFTDDDSTL